MKISQVIQHVKFNDEMILLLLNGEQFIVEEVKKAEGSLNNTIIKLQTLKVVDDEDGLPEVVPSGIFRSYRYDREDIKDIVRKKLPKIDMVPTIEHDGEVNSNSIVDSLLSYDLNLGYGAIDVELITGSNIVILRCNNKSIRFHGETRIAIV